MKFSAPIAEFQKALQRALPAIPPKSTLPVLEHLHFNLEDTSLKIIGTDQDITILYTLPVTGVDDGSILIPGRKLNDIVKALNPEGNLEISSNDENFEVIIRSNTGEYKIKGLNPDEYLELPELFESEKADANASTNGNHAVFHKNEITRLAEKTVFAVSSDEFRPAMTGVFFQFRGDFVNAVATDSYRLAKAVAFSQSGELPSELDLIIPSRAIELLRKVDDDVKMSVIERQGKVTHVRFEVGKMVFISRIIDEKFPPYESVIPKNNDLVAVVDRSEFINSIKRCGILTSSISKQLRMELTDNKIVLRGQDEDISSAKEEVKADYNGKEMEIGFNYKFLEEALQNIDENETKDNRVYLSFSEPNRPALVKPDPDGNELLMLIMPVRL